MSGPGAVRVRLYHFTKQEFGVRALRDRRLKIARISELNDPFEFLGWNVQDAATRAELRAWKAAQNDVWGIVCFSRGWSHPLLWSHYADKHRGMALGFDVPDNDLYSPVRYQRRRLPFPRREFGRDDVGDVVLTKFTAWRYEAEYRCFCLLADSVRDGDLYFERFSETLRLAQVIVGDLATISRAELADALGGAVGVDRFKARPAYGSFEVVENLNGSLWK
jgi:hypothetical protein